MDNTPAPLGTRAGAALAAVTTGAQILFHQRLQLLPRAVCTCSLLPLMGQGTFCCWWVQMQEFISDFPSTFLKAGSWGAEQSGILPQQKSRAELSHKDRSHMCVNS